MIKVVLCDDHAVVRRGVRDTLMEATDVQVVGVPDAKYGEELCAWIVLKPDAAATEDDIRSFCRGQIAHYKIPRHIRFVAGFPMTVTGKIQKFLIREAMTRELAGG